MNDHRRRDSGFTLIELLISIALMGVIASATAAMMQVSLLTVPKISGATDAARTLQGVVTWLPQDVDSTPPSGFSTDAAVASGCIDNPGVNLLRMEWTEDIGAGVIRYIADYRHVTVSDESRIVRVTCSGAGSGPLGNSQMLRASSAIPPLPPGWASGDLPVSVVTSYDAVLDSMLVTVELETLTGALLRVEAAPKNPAKTLPTTTVAGATTTSTSTSTTSTTTTTIPSSTTTTEVGSTSTTSTTSTTTTTAPPPPPCVVVSSSISPTSAKNTDPNGNGKSAVNVGVLGVSVTVTVSTTGWCVGLEARATTGAPNGELFRNFTQTGSTYKVVFPGYPQGSSELWKDGLRTISFYSPTGGPYGSVTLDVK